MNQKLYTNGMKIISDIRQFLDGRDDIKKIKTNTSPFGFDMLITDIFGQPYRVIVMSPVERKASDLEPLPEEDVV